MEQNQTYKTHHNLAETSILHFYGISAI